MAKKYLTVFQKLEKTLIGDTSNNIVVPSVNTYNIKKNNVIDVATSPEEYQMKLSQARQQQLMARQWVKASYDLENKSLAGLNDVRLMYREVDLMDGFPEIGTALDIFSEETTCLNNKGFMINITSKSDRIKSILNDLFVNRLSINTVLPMICRSMCKYGNNFMLLNLDKNNGVMGWKQLPVYEMERYENGMANPYQPAPSHNLNNITQEDIDNVNDTKFVWVGQNAYTPYINIQVAHFRLLYDSQFLPYGMSILNKARRHWRMLSMMEDSMLIYRLDRSIERRVFKVDVGAIAEEDVPAFIDDAANKFKRTPIVDPMTGQLDLRKNILNQMDDFFIPVRDPSQPSPIEILPAGQNLSAMEDIKYIQNKIFTALRVPKSFLNFEEEKGDGKNLSMMDVRFTRTVNRIQQALLMELNKIAMIHLYLLGFVDEISNFSLSMNNPSSQAEMLEIENIAKKITTAKDAIAPPGDGLPLMSITWALRNIMGLSDKEILENFEELRLEAAITNEWKQTPQIIKNTGIFDAVDNLYGEPGAEYTQNQQNDENGMNGGGISGGAPIGGGDFDFGEEGDMEGDNLETGTEGEMDMNTNTNEDNMMDSTPNDGNIPPVNDSIIRSLNILTENKKRQETKKIIEKREKYFNNLCERLLKKTLKEETLENDILENKIINLNNEMFKTIKELDKYKDNL